MIRCYFLLQQRIFVVLKLSLELQKDKLFGRKIGFLTKNLDLKMHERHQNKIIAWLKRLGWAGFFFFLIKGVTLYIVLPYLIAKGVISCEK